jgi:hypothetical protein
MAYLKDGSRVYGNLTVDTAVIAGAGAGFQNMVLFTTGTNTTYEFPAALQVPGAKFKVTMIGGGGGGGGCAKVANYQGAGGGSGGVTINYFTVVSGVYTFTYSVGAAGAAGAATTSGTGGTAGTTTLRYNNLYYESSGGWGGGPGAAAFSPGGSGGAASTGTLNFAGNPGQNGGRVVSASLVQACYGGLTPLGFGGPGGWGTGQGGGTPTAGVMYGAGGTGGRMGTGAGAAVTGGAGGAGLIILEY